LKTLSNVNTSELLKDINSYKRKPSKTDFYILEGLRCISQSINNGIVPRLIVFSKDFQKKKGNEFYLKIKELFPIMIVSDSIFKRLSSTENPAGILALCVKHNIKLSEILYSSPLFLLDSIQDPGNLGTIFRTAVATGFAGILLGKGCVNPYNPKVVRASLGAIATLPFAFVENIDDTIDKLKKEYSVFAADKRAEKNIWNFNFSKNKIVFLIGNEANGLAKNTIKKCTASFKIPLEQAMESLNAAISSSIIAYEYIRQQ